MKTSANHIEPTYAIDGSRFDNADYITARVENASVAARGSLRSVLSFLYLTDGPNCIVKPRYLQAKGYLEPAEQIVVSWLRTRTTGRLKKTYGHTALVCARSKRYKCETCGFADVRALHLDHVQGKITGGTFACLCANCHNIKSRRYDWTGKRRYPKQNA